MKCVIFDLDQTLVDSSTAEIFRNNKHWKQTFNLIPTFKIFDGIYNLMKLLRSKDYILVIITSSPKKYALKVLSTHAIYYDYLIAYNDTILHKPHPAPYFKAINDLGLFPKNTYALGDHKNDMIAANSAEIITCACFWGTKNFCELFNAPSKFKFITVKDAINFFQSLK